MDVGLVRRYIGSMERINTILVALGERTDGPLLTSAIEMARHYRARLFLLRVTDPRPALSPPHGLFVVAASVSICEAAALRELGKVAAGVPAELLADMLVRSGVAWEVICETARDQSADLIVLGSQDNAPRWRRSTAARVVDRASCPVIVIRDHVRAAA